MAIQEASHPRLQIPDRVSLSDWEMPKSVSWRLDAFMGKLDDSRCLGTVPDAMIKSNRFCKVLVQLRGNVIAVSRNNEAIFQGLQVGASLLSGEVGVSCMRSRMVFKEFEFCPRARSTPASVPAKGS